MYTLSCSIHLLFASQVYIDPGTQLQVRYIKSRVSKVQPSDDQQDGGTITLADGTALPYDWLVLALGADANLGALPCCAAVAPFVHRQQSAQTRVNLPCSSTVLALNPGFSCHNCWFC